MNLPFQFDVGMPTQIVTLSPIGGWVVIAVTRQMPAVFGSTAADSIVVLGNFTFRRLSQLLTGLASGMRAFGPGAGVRTAPRPAPPGPAAPRAPCCAGGCWARDTVAIKDSATARNLRFTV